MKILFTLLLLIGHVAVFAAGSPTHQFMADRAIEALDSSEDATLRRLLESNRQTVLSGATFPDSGYAAGILLAAENTLFGGTFDYGELAHWDHFVQGYARYIRKNCSADELLFKTDEDFTSPCAVLVAHAMGVAAHGIGDEIWDVMFETVYAQQDGLPEGALSEGTTLSPIPPTIRDLILQSEEFASGLDMVHDGIRSNVRSNGDVTASYEYSMDVAIIADHDRYGDIQVPEAVTANRDIPLPIQSMLNSAYTAFSDLNGNPQQVPVASLPDLFTLADIANEACDRESAAPEFNGKQFAINDCRQWRPQDFGMGLAAGTALLLAETVAAPYDSTRVRDQSPWAYNNYLLNSGGIIDSAYAIRGYWRGFLARLQNRYTHSAIINVHPKPGEKNVPVGPSRSFYSESGFIGANDRRREEGDSRGLISIMLDNEFDWGSVIGRDGQLPALQMFKLGSSVAMAGSFRATYFCDNDSACSDTEKSFQSRGRRQLWFVPKQALEPSTTYVVTISTQLQDYMGNPLKSPISWSFTTEAMQ